MSFRRRNVSGRVACGMMVGSAIAAALFGACGREIDSRPDESDRVNVRAAPSETGATPSETGASEDSASPPGANGYRTHLYTEADADVHALFEPDGPEASSVRAVYVDVGRRVGRGQVLALLENTREALAVEAAGARADEARAQAERARQLLEQELVPRAEHESLTNSLRVAEAELRQAQLELARTRVRAPFAGVVARRYIRVGQRIEPGTPLFRITALAPLRARVLVPERQAGAFRPGASVRVTGVDGVSGDGRIVLLSPTVDPASGTREVVVELVTPSGFLPGAEVIVEPHAEEAET
jgi:RND family efflux transporter MFP subunit